MAVTVANLDFPRVVTQTDIKATEAIVAIFAGSESRCPHRPNSLTPYWAQEDWIKCRAMELAKEAVVITNLGHPDRPEDI